MGNKLQSKCKSSKDGGIIPTVASITQRENMATWHRTDIPLTDVYEIMDILGQGHMGKVYKVVRKVENRGLHNADTREKKLSSGNLMAGTGADTGVDADMDRIGDSERSVGIYVGSDSGRKNSDSPFRKKNKKDTIARRDEELLKQLQHKKEGEILEAAIQNLSRVEKPKPILRKTKYANPSGTWTSTDGMEALKVSLCSTSLASGEVMFCGMETSDFSDEHNLSVHGDAHDEISHTHFADEDDSASLNSLLEQSKDALETASVVTGTIKNDNGLDDDNDIGKNKKWVPRRKIRFQRLYACKTIATEKIKDGQLNEMLNEIYMMRKIDHPYIIRLYEVYQVKRQLWLVMDLCQGGNLTTRKLNEPQVTVIAEQILRGVAYLHRRGICHRDLKQENILYEDTSPNSSIRLIDFGLTKAYNSTTKKDSFGAAYCLSPEIVAGTAPYTDRSDVWSIGVIVWIQLAGDYPFMKTDEDLKDEAKRIKLINASYAFGITWNGRGISEHAKSFVRGCLKKNPKERWSAIQALEYLQDKWIPALEEKEKIGKQLEKERLATLKIPTMPKRRTTTDIEISEPSSVLDGTFSSKSRKDTLIFDPLILDHIKRYVSYSLLKKTILLTLANMIDRKEVSSLSEIFLLVDTEQTGTISRDELKEAFRKMNMQNIQDLSDDEMDQIFSGMDHDKSGQLHYAEFLAAVSEGAGLVSMDRLSDAFDRIDAEGKGYISHGDLKNILGENYSKDVVDEMIEEGDFKKKGLVDFNEFVQLMTMDAEEAIIS